MKGVFVSFVFIVIVVTGFSQQLPHFSQYMINDFFINPAVAGSDEEALKAMVSYRSQWTGFTDAPQTGTAGFHYRFKEKMGIGALLFTDKTGPISRTGAQFAYAYHARLNDQVQLGLGLSAMLYQHVLDKTSLTLDQPNDMAMQGGKDKMFTYDGIAGTYLYSKSFFAGISIPQVLQTSLIYNDIEDSPNKLVRHFFVHGGYNFTLTEELVIQPSLLLKGVAGPPVQVDINAKLLYKEFLWIGGSYRNAESVIILLGFQKGTITAGYSYDITLSNIKNHSTGSHEVFLGVNLRSPSKFNKNEN